MMALNPKKNKRKLIMEAAVQVFSQKGYHRSKMEEIALAAGIGKGTIYEYFPSKLQLLQEIMEQSSSMYDHILAKDINISLSIEDSIRMLIEGHLRFCQNNRELTALIFADTDILDEDLKNWARQDRRKKEEYLQSLFAQAIQNGEILSLDTKLLSIILNGILLASCMPILVEGWEVEAGTAAREITDIIMQGIKIR